MADLQFKKTVIGELVNNVGPGQMNTFSTAGDINHDGLIDLVVSGRNGKMMWFENKGEDAEWVPHFIDDAVHMECGGSVYDLTGSGYLDIINGGDWQCDEIYWWENPGSTEKLWEKRLIHKTGCGQFHDTIIGDVTNVGKVSIVFTNQHGGTTIYCAPLPEDPAVSPWPDIQVVASGMMEENPYRKEGLQPEEGLAFGDIDGDGKNEIVCGTHWYKYIGSTWEAHKFAKGYITTKVAIGDIDGDGKNEIVLSEGDPCVYGKTQGGKLSWFKPGSDITGLWEEHVIDDYLYDPHSLQLGDICGNGRLDIFTGEVGMADSDTDLYINRQPRLMVYENDGCGNFKRHVIDEGTGIHEALLVDLRNCGTLDIIGKPLHGPEKWKLHVWYREDR